MFLLAGLHGCVAREWKEDLNSKSEEINREKKTHVKSYTNCYFYLLPRVMKRGKNIKNNSNNLKNIVH